MDIGGEYVHEWQHELRTATVAYLLPNGNLLHTVFSEKTSGAPQLDVFVEELTWDGELVWRFSMKSFGARIHHDVERLPNGNTLVIAAEEKSREACLAVGRKPELLSERDLKVDGVFEIRPTGKTEGEVVWKWSAWDHLVQDYDSEKNYFGVPSEQQTKIDVNQVRPNAKRLMDWLHLNTVAYNVERDVVMVCCHALSETWIISRKSGELVRRWGNPQIHGEGTAADQQLFGHHDAHWIAEGLPGAGHVLLFNNGLDRAGDFSTVMEFVVDLDADIAERPTLVWEYPRIAAERPNERGEAGHEAILEERKIPLVYDKTERLFSRILSGAQRLPNGNTLICFGEGALLVEVTPAGEAVWKYRNPAFSMATDHRGRQQENMLFRAYRYAPDYPAFVGRLGNGERTENGR